MSSPGFCFHHQWTSRATYIFVSPLHLRWAVQGENLLKRFVFQGPSSSFTQCRKNAQLPERYQKQSTCSSSTALVIIKHANKSVIIIVPCMHQQALITLTSLTWATSPSPRAVFKLRPLTPLLFLSSAVYVLCLAPCSLQPDCLLWPWRFLTLVDLPSGLQVLLCFLCLGGSCSAPSAEHPACCTQQVSFVVLPGVPVTLCSDRKCHGIAGAGMRNHGDLNDE